MMKALGGMNQTHVNTSPTVQTAAISQNCCCGETATSIWGDVSVCLSQNSSLQAFHRHVVCLFPPSPSPPPSLPLVLFQSRRSFSTHTPTTPTPPRPFCALSGHPPCLFRWNRRGNESTQSTVNPFLGLCSAIVCIPAIFSTLLPCFDDDFFFVYIRSQLTIVVLSNVWGKIPCTEDAAKNTHTRIFVALNSMKQKKKRKKGCTTFEDNNCGLVNVQLGIFFVLVGLWLHCKSAVSVSSCRLGHISPFDGLLRFTLPQMYKLLCLCSAILWVCLCVCTVCVEEEGLYAQTLCLCSSLPRSCLVTTQPGQDNMDTTVAEWPFWVKALCNNKQLLAEWSCFPAAHQCQNTELTAVPFTAVEKRQPSKPTYLQRLWTACNPSAARRLLETSELRLLPKEISAHLLSYVHICYSVLASVFSREDRRVIAWA